MKEAPKFLVGWYLLSRAQSAHFTDDSLGRSLCGLDISERATYRGAASISDFKRCRKCDEIVAAREKAAADEFREFRKRRLRLTRR